MMELFNMSNKKRLFAGYILWAIGIALGTALLVGASSILASGKASIHKAFPNAQVYHLKGAQNTYWSEAQEIIKAFPGLQEQIPVYQAPGIAEVSRKIVPVSVIGTTERYLKFKQAKLFKGGFLSDYSIDQAQNTAVISSDVSLKLFGTKDGIGRELELKMNDNTVKLFVAGVVLDKTDEANYCYIPASLFEDLSPDTGLDSLILSTVSNIHPREAEALAVHMMDMNGIQGWTAKHYLYNDFLAETYDRYLYHVIALAGLLLLLGATGSSGSIASLVRNSRKRIRLAIFYGLSQQTLKSEIICLGLYGGITQGLFGIVLGLAASLMVNRYLGLPFAVDPIISFFALTAAATMGILSGLYPALMAWHDHDKN